MNIAIMGQGCMASVFAYYIDDRNTQILSRSATPSVQPFFVENTPIELKGQAKSSKSINFDNIELLIIPVKSYHNQSFVEEFQNRISPDTCLLIIQNGIGFIDVFTQAFIHNPIICGLSTDGAYRNADGTVHFVGKGKLTLGSLQYATPDMALPILSKHPNAHWSAHIENDIYQKLLINAAINPLTFINSIKNGELKDVDTVHDIIDEIFLVFDALGIEYTPDTWRKSVFDVIAHTHANQSSMLQDRLSQRKTEIDAIVGAIIKKAASHKVRTPLLKSLYSRVKRIEHYYLS